MEQLLQDYLNNTSESYSDNNTVYSCEVDGHLCLARYRARPEDDSVKEIRVNIWEVMAYIHSLIKKQE